MKTYKKAITFSFDDGTLQDKRLIALLDKYGLKCTFNINSDLLGKPGELNFWGQTVDHTKLPKEEVREIYRNHEVAAHTLTHPMLPEQEDAEVIRQVEEDRKALSALVGYEVVGMAYPCGGQNNDDRVAGLIQAHTGIRYARTIQSTHSFAPQMNLFRFNPTVHIMEREKMLELADQFLALETQEPKLFYIWGHAFELDHKDGWEWFEEFCKKISGKDDIFYGTNAQVFGFA